MAHNLTRYNIESHASLRSHLLLNTPDAVPPIDELEAVHAELRALKQKSLERARKAEGDLRVLEGAIKKVRDLERGKAKAHSKVKRESSYTPGPQEDRSYSPSIFQSPGNAASSSSAPPVNASSSLPSKLLPEMRKTKKKDKDKKRKRDDESDGEHETVRPRKFSPLPPSHKEHHYKPSKLSNVTHAKTSGPDWSLPPPHPLLPQRPPHVPLPPPGPRKPDEVTEDFSKAKAPATQVPITTFYTSIEPWLRPIREEDIGWLEYTADEVEPYVVPKLGRYYTEAWEEEDIQFYGGVPTLLDFSNSRAGPSSSSISASPLPKWDSATLAESDLVMEKGLGPVTERLVTALLPAADQSTWKSLKEAEDKYEARMAASKLGVNGSLAKDKVFVSEFEERVKETTRYYGLLSSEPDFSQTVDDPISTALRQAQRQLREVVARNKARRARLVTIARDRMAYQEYVEIRDSIDKNITTMFSKLQKKDGPKASKKKKKADANGGANGVNGGAPPVPLPNPAAIGLGPDEEGKLVVPESLKALIETRREWVDVIGGGFDNMEGDRPDHIRGLPQSSVFDGIEEEVRFELERRDVAPWMRSATEDRANGSSLPGPAERE